MFSSILLLLTLVLHMVFLVTFSLIITVFFGKTNIVNVTIATFILWVFYIILSEYIVLYFYNVKTAKLNSEFRDIISLFSFKNRDRDVKIYSSATSPIVMRIGLFNSSKLIINQELINNFESIEIKTLLDMELSYAKTMSSLTEVLLQKLYFISWLPLKTLLSNFINKEIVEYFLLPMVTIFKAISLQSRKRYLYKGKFLTTLPQVIFKAKIKNLTKERVPLFGYSLKNLEYIKSVDDCVKSDVSRFNLDEIIQ